jgi:hypothetical protein
MFLAISHTPHSDYSVNLLHRTDPLAGESPRPRETRLRTQNSEEFRTRTKERGSEALANVIVRRRPAEVHLPPASFSLAIHWIVKVSDLAPLASL